MDVLKLDTKWVSTIASIWIQCTSGSLYTFSIYSSVLKSTQAYDQSTLDTVSVFKDIGANAGVLSGASTPPPQQLIATAVLGRGWSTWQARFNAFWGISWCGPPLLGWFLGLPWRPCACSCWWRLTRRASSTLLMSSLGLGTFLIIVALLLVLWRYIVKLLRYFFFWRVFIGSYMSLLLTLLYYCLLWQFVTLTIIKYFVKIVRTLDLLLNF